MHYFTVLAGPMCNATDYPPQGFKNITSQTVEILHVTAHDSATASCRRVVRRAGVRGPHQTTEKKYQLRSDMLREGL